MRRNGGWRLLAVLALLTATLLAAAAGLLVRELKQPLPLASTQTIELPRGGHLISLAEQLQRRGLISQPLALRLFARLHGLEALKAGTYSLQPGSSIEQLLIAMVNAETVLERITFPEGWTVAQWQRAMAARGLLAEAPPLSWQQLATAPPVADAAGSVEGWLFPDTYHFRDREGRKIAQLAVSRMAAELDRVWRNRAVNLPYSNRYQLLIMASIIERETGVAAERAQIAGVFVRRLQRGMRLQTDPTVIYGLGDSFDGDLRRADLKRATPYNTYMIDGLPPTPIANPGLASLEAAAHPAPGEWLYFVGKGDGSHHFSVTLAEHQSAVKRYQRFGRAQQYRSSPPP